MIAAVDSSPDSDRGPWTLRRLVAGIIRHPSEAMAALARTPGRRWIWPLLALAIVTVVVSLLLGPRLMAATLASQGMGPVGVDGAGGVEIGAGAAQAQRFFGVVGAVFGFFGVFISAAIGAAVLHLLGTIFGGQQGYLAVFTTTSWARIPLIFEGLLRIAWFGTHPGDMDASIEGLSGLVVEAPLPADSGFLGPVLGLVDVWNLWFLVLLGIAVRAFAKISTRKAVIVVGIYVVLGLAVSWIGVWVRGLVPFPGG